MKSFGTVAVPTDAAEIHLRLFKHAQRCFKPLNQIIILPNNCYQRHIY